MGRCLLGFRKVLGVGVSGPPLGLLPWEQVPRPRREAPSSCRSDCPAFQAPMTRKRRQQQVSQAQQQVSQAQKGKGRAGGPAGWCGYAHPVERGWNAGHMLQGGHPARLGREPGRRGRAYPPHRAVALHESPAATCVSPDVQQLVPPRFLEKFTSKKVKKGSSITFSVKVEGKASCFTLRTPREAQSSPSPTQDLYTPGKLSAALPHSGPPPAQSSPSPTQDP